MTTYTLTQLLSSVCRCGKREIMYPSLHFHHQNDSCIQMGSDESHFNVSLIAMDKVTVNSVHGPQLLKRKKSRSGFEPRSSVYQPNALPLGQTGSLPACYSYQKACSVVCPHLPPPPPPPPAPPSQPAPSCAGRQCAMRSYLMRPYPLPSFPPHPPSPLPPPLRSPAYFLGGGDVELHVLGMSVDMLGTNCDQCLSTVQCCFTSTETVRLVRTLNFLS